MTLRDMKRLKIYPQISASPTSAGLSDAAIAL